MPGSAISSSAGTSSHSSRSSNRARTRQYRTVAHTAQVDESLFGEPNRDAHRQQLLEKKWRQEAASPLEEEAQRRSAGRQKKDKKSKETVQVITKDLIRNLIVPSEDPSGQSLILPSYEFYRIRNAARILTDEDKKHMAEMHKMAKEEQMSAVADRKQYMKQHDVDRVQNEKLSELEEEEREKREYLKEKANAQRQEQEDEIKKLNELILNAKCHAIRDAQILEKRQIKSELVEEEQRLDAMMEADRLNSIQVEESINQRRKQDRMVGAMKVMEQIQENEQNRLLELERKDQENRHLQKYLDKLCEEEAQKLSKRREEQQKLREDLNECNSDIIHRKQLMSEQEKLEEMKVLEYQQKKAEREQAYEMEQERIRVEKEKEVARLRAQQERARDEQAERDLLRAKRTQEQAEREWRRKEAEEAHKKAETESSLKAARHQQMEQKEHFLAVQAQRERADFERVLRAQQELVQKEAQEEDERHRKRSDYAEEVRRQIQQKEHQRIADRNAFFDEGVKLDEEARQRRQKLEDIKRKKLEQLRKIGLAEKYVTQVARKGKVSMDRDNSAAGIHEKYLTQVERKAHQAQHIAA